jgi:acyl-CoA reductase-like NAD-dependent aldehyde dehydrogenase
MKNTDAITAPATMLVAEARGVSLVGGLPSGNGRSRFHAVEPRTGLRRNLAFIEATEAEVAESVSLASASFETLAEIPASALADLLERIGENLVAMSDRLIAVAEAETGLARPRLLGEHARTCHQLLAFAHVIRAGQHHDPIIDTAVPDATPAPVPDLRRVSIPTGPVAVFSASNFPFAFSVAGGDTASALAAGCPVIVKAHPSHPETSELAAFAVLDAVAALGFPRGTFSLIQGRGHAPGRQLVEHPGVTAVGFTGSEGAGRALMDLAMARPVPIPVYAEMGSLNPIVITAAAMAARGQVVAQGLAASVLLGGGQFCTKPGLVLAPAGRATEAFIDTVVGLVVTEGPANYMLSEPIQARFAEHVTEHLAPLTAGRMWQGPTPQVGICAPGTVTVLEASELLLRPDLLREHFGPSCIVAVYRSLDELAALIAALPGGLTATLHAEPEESGAVGSVVAALRAKAGRLLWNQFPTGVAVVGSMHHGGPYPASTFQAHTSVGWTAVRRFQRPVAYQNFPDESLPPALRDGNPLKITRLVNGELTKEPISR